MPTVIHGELGAGSEWPWAFLVDQVAESPCEAGVLCAAVPREAPRWGPARLPMESRAASSPVLPN